MGELLVTVAVLTALLGPVVIGSIAALLHFRGRRQR